MPESKSQLKTPEQIRKFIARQAPGVRLVAHAFATIHPVELSQSRYLDMLKSTNIRAPGLELGHKLLREAVAALKQAGALAQTGSSSAYLVQPAWLLPLLESAKADGHLPHMIGWFKRHYFLTGYGLLDKSSQARTRCALVLGDSALLLDDFRHPLDWAVLLEPGMLRYAHALPEKEKGQALHRLILQCIETVRDCTSLFNLLRGAELPAPAVDDLAWLHLLRGEMDEAQALFANRSRSRKAKVRTHSIAAFRSLIEGDTLAARRSLESALEAERGDSRKQILFPDHPAFAVATLALLRDATAETRDAFQRSLKHAKKLGIGEMEYSLLEIAETILNNPDLRLRAPEIESEADQVLLTLALCWSRSTDLPVNMEPLAQIEQIGAAANRYGYRWLAAECHAILSFANEQPIDDSEPHKQLGTRSLVDLITPAPAWERALQQFEQLAVAARQKKPTKQQPANKQQVRKRLAWYAVYDEYGRLDMQPREQSLRGSGWTKGRVIALKRLKEQAAELDYLSDKDREAATRVRDRDRGWGYGREYTLGAQGIWALAGHPWLFDEEGDPITIVTAEPALQVEDLDRATIEVKLQPYPRSSESYQLAARTDPATLCVLHLPSASKPLAQLVPEEGLRLPSAAKARLMEALAALAGDIRVHGTVDIEDHRAQVAADAEPWLLIQPAGQGLNVHLQVEPITGSGAYFDPGQGGRVVLAQRDGEEVQTRRDLDAERAAAEQLVRLCPMLRRADPAQVTFEFDEPEDCLELLDQLRTAGARCLWPKGESMKIAASASATDLRLTIKSSREWFAASGELQVDESRALGLAQLMMLLAQRPRSRFVPLEDGTFVALSRAFRKQLNEFAALTSGRSKHLRLHPLLAPALDEIFDEAEVDADQAWLDLQNRLIQAKAVNTDLPATLRADLRPYQHEGYAWLVRLATWGVGACLADDMGLGKTLQTLAALLRRAELGPSLVVVPTSLVENWRSEARRFAPTLNLVDYQGANRKTLLDDRAAADVVLCTYGLLLNDIEAFEAIEWNCVVLDEAQAIKNLASKRARAVRKLNATARIATTGTPIQNNLMDLYAIFAFLNPGLLGTAAEFRERYMLPIERSNDDDCRARLARVIDPFMLRRTKSEVLDDLPARTEITVPVPLSGDEATLYEAIRRQALNELESNQEPEGTRRMNALAHLTRLRLSCCHPSLVQDTGITHSAKTSAFLETMDELRSAGHKVLVFSQFVKHLKLLAAELDEAGVTYQYLDGSTPTKERGTRVAAFQNGEGDAFLISLKAGGTGLNLTAADYVIHMDPWWNPAAEDQASDRAHRIGQTRPVTIYRFVAKGTIEEQIVELHRHKRALADALLSDQSSSAALDSEALLELIRASGTEA